MNAPRVKLDIDATREKLAALGLGHAVDALEGLLAEAVRAEMPAHVFLDRLLEAERSGREERRIRTMLKTSKIPTGQTLENLCANHSEGRKSQNSRGWRRKMEIYIQ
jgi:DNA replication protein DnaC